MHTICQERGAAHLYWFWRVWNKLLLVYTAWLHWVRGWRLGGWYIEDNNRKDSTSAVVVSCSHIYDLHLVERIRLYNFQCPYEIGEQIHAVVHVLKNNPE